MSRGRARHRWARGAGLAVVATLAVAGCTTAEDPTASPPGGGGPAGTNPTVALPNLELASALQPFDACDDLLGWVKDQALQRVTAYGLSTPYQKYEGVATAIEDGAPAPSTAPDAAPQEGSLDSASRSADEFQTASGGSTDHSTTNVQEEGVDEPDTIKNDGQRILAVVDDRLEYVDVTDEAPVVAGALELPDASGAQLLVDGDRVLVMSQKGGVHPYDDVVTNRGVAVDSYPYPGATEPEVVLTLVDVADPAAMTVLTSVRIDGSSLSARMVDGRARIVTTASPTALPFVYPSSPSGEETAEETNRRIIEESTIDDWLPHVHTGTSTSDTGDVAVACDQVRHPKEFSGFDVLSVQTVDLAGDAITPGDATAILASGQTVYASAHNLYVATPSYVEPPGVEPSTTPGTAVPGGGPSGTTPGTEPEPTTTVVDPEQDEEPWQPPQPSTSIHRFGIEGGGPAEYRASGEVPGYLLDQFSMSEHDDHLRVATTDGWVGTSRPPESWVRVLEERDGELVEVGSVGGLGRGEQIRAVRFLGDQGYVVTFRQTDPLYTIDLADPAHPTIAGELKILGYSAYLHPIGDGLLIGIGQDATEQGRVTGTQVALFDVSDPANPRRIQQHLVGVGSSIAENDHHAFLWWDPTDLAVIPVQNYDEGWYVQGAIGYRITPDGIEEVGRVSHPTSFAGGATSGGTEGEGDGGPTTTVVCGPELCQPPAPPLPCPTAGRCTPYPPSSGSAPIQRALVIGDRLYTVSTVGVLASQLADLAPVAGVDFSR